MDTQTYAFLLLAALLFTLAVLFASIMIFDLGKKFELKRKQKIQLSEKDLLLADHNYDNIQELDNKPPAWFQFLFYVTIVFGIVYMINYHLLGKPNLMYDEYQQEIQEANNLKEKLAQTGALINETNVTLLTDSKDIEEGKNIFVANCTNCHGDKGQGVIGPNLTDSLWIHGCSIKEIFAVISNGVPAKGMISWKTQLNPKQIQQVASYVKTLGGTNPPNPKAPEGVPCVDTTSVVKTVKDTVSKNNP
jgi:cytochrome c oxidase cbb3-type subunit 3